MTQVASPIPLTAEPTELTELTENTELTGLTQSTKIPQARPAGREGATPAAAPPAPGMPVRIETPVRRLRADAERNRNLLIATATTAFTDRGVDVPLEEVARSAGVGIATLYRNFPTREALVLAVYTQQIDDLQEAARTLPARFAPAEALHEWMRAFVRYGSVKRGLITLLKTIVQSDSSLFDRSRATLSECGQTLLDGASAAGEIRADVGGAELVGAISGICLATNRPGAEQSALSLVDLVFDGLRFGARAIS